MKKSQLTRLDMVSYIVYTYRCIDPTMIIEFQQPMVYYIWLLCMLIIQYIGPILVLYRSRCICITTYASRVKYVCYQIIIQCKDFINGSRWSRGSQAAGCCIIGFVLFEIWFAIENKLLRIHKLMDFIVLKIFEKKQYVISFIMFTIGNFILHFMIIFSHFFLIEIHLSNYGYIE